MTTAAPTSFYRLWKFACQHKAILQSSAAFFAGIIAVIGFGFALNFYVRFKLDHGMTLRARFSNVMGLREGDPVRMSGRSVGRVRAMFFSPGQVEVIMKITDRSVRLHTDSIASIRVAIPLATDVAAVSGVFCVELNSGNQAAPVASEGAVLSTAEARDWLHGDGQFRPVGGTPPSR